MVGPSRSKRSLKSASPVYKSIPPQAGNLSAMLDLMKPLQLPTEGDTDSRRQLLADLCRLVGVSVGANTRGSVTSLDAPGDSSLEVAEEKSDLSPRQGQTLALLLQGHSEKQVARALGVSVHTVHVYVKAIYRRFDVSSRAELLALHVGVNRPRTGIPRTEN